MLYLFGIGINLFLILLLSSKKNKILADKFLLVWLIIICCHLLLFIVATTSNNNYPDVFAIAPLFALLHWPMLYLYTAAMTNMLPANKKIWALHFVPFLGVLVIIIPFFVLTSEEKINVIDSGGQGYKIETGINAYAMLLSGIVYVIWLLIILRKHKKNIANQFSYDEKIKLNWLRYLIYGLGIIWIIIIAQSVNATSYDNYIFAAAVLLVIIIGYFGVKQGRIYSNTITQQLNNHVERIIKDKQPISINDLSANDVKIYEDTPIYGSEEQADIAVKKKYAKSGLTETAAENLYEKLKELMQQEKYYTEPELSLAKLAERVNIHPNYLSQVINEKEGKNFYDYINTLRVEEFKLLLLIPENSKFTMISLALDCGFNSKSSFNKNFKKVTGQSPSEYLNIKAKG
jgi:AraC-like DNA-binding protein